MLRNQIRVSEFKSNIFLGLNMATKRRAGSKRSRYQSGCWFTLAAVGRLLL